LPLAKSPFEKMEMRGEKVDVNRIKQNVQEGMGNIKDRMSSWGEEVKSSAQKMSERAKEFTRTQGADFAADVKRTAKPVASGIGHAIGVIIKAFFLFVFGSIAFGLFVGLMVVIFGGGTVLWPLKQALMEFVLNGFWQKFFFWGTLIFFIAVPIVAFLTWLIRRIMRVRSQKSYLGWVFGGLWTLGWISIIMFVSLLARDFRTERETTEEIRISQPANGRLLLTVSEPAIQYKNDLFFTDIDNNGWDFTDDSLKLANVQLDFDASKDSNYYVSIIKSSRGRDYNQAEALAGRIQYHVSAQDSVLDLGSGYGIARADKFRDQEVTVLISVPVGKNIRFDESVADKLNPHNFTVKRSRRGVRMHYESRWVFGYKTGIDYIMDSKGYLKSEEDLQRDAEREMQKQNDEIKVQDTSANSAGKDSLQRMLQEEKIKREESEKKIRQLEKQMKNKGTGYHRVRRDDDSLLPFMPSVFI
jgi:hypothetical protein